MSLFECALIVFQAIFVSISSAFYVHAREQQEPIRLFGRDLFILTEFECPKFFAKHGTLVQLLYAYHSTIIRIFLDVVTFCWSLYLYGLSILF